MKVTTVPTAVIPSKGSLFCEVEDSRLGDKMNAKFFTEDINKNLIEQAYLDIEDIQRRSVPHKFEFSIWRSGLGSEVFEARAPKCEDFRCVLTNEFYQVIDFYSHTGSRYTASSDAGFRLEKMIPTLQTNNVLRAICSFASSLDWQNVPSHLKVATWLLACGFDDNFRNPETEILPVWNESECVDYLLAEEEICNMYKVNQFPWSNEKIIACEYFKIEEEKTDPAGMKYLKNRYVCNMIPANDQIPDSALAADLEYNFVTAETIFSDLDLFKKLQVAKYLSVVDKKNYYRQLVCNPSLCSAVVSKDGNKYIDLKLKQGHKFSSCFAQLASDFFDLVFRKKFCPNLQASLQDDSMIIHVNDDLSLDDIVNLNKEYGFELNSKKTVFRTKSLVWSGYLWNVETATLAIPFEKLEKVKILTIKILSEPCTRREYAKLLGKIYSYRLLAAGARANFAILTHNTRRHMFRGTGNFYQELKNLTHFSKKYLVKYKRFFDKTLQPDESLSYELNRVVEIVETPRNFADVRTYIFGNNSLPVSCFAKDSALLFTDSSLRAGGAFLKVNEKFFSFSVKFSEEDEDLRNASINIKELYIAILAILWTLEISQIYPLKSVITFIDNECAKSLAFTRKANLKSTKLLQLTEVLNNILMSCDICFYFTRVPTDQNQAADFLSRNPDENFCQPVGENWRFQALIKNFTFVSSPSKVLNSSGQLRQRSDTSSAEQESCKTTSSTSSTSTAKTASSLARSFSLKP